MVCDGIGCLFQDSEIFLCEKTCHLKGRLLYYVSDYLHKEVQMGTRTRMTREDRRKQIIESAMNVFKEKGFKGTTTAEIADSAEITEVTLFRYFTSKQEIYLEGVRPFIVKTLEEVVETSAGMTPRERLQAILLDRITFISENYETIKLILNESPELSGMGVDLSSEIRRIIEKSIGQAPIREDMRPMAVRMIMGSLLSFLYMPEQNAKSIRNYVYQITDLLLDTMQGDRI